jgi:hypothetical protein
MPKRPFVSLFRKGNKHQINIEVEVIEYQDKNLFYAYTPSLSLVGYGNTVEEARKSWEVVLEEYFRYTTNKQTLVQDLENHGWQVSKNNVNPPSIAWLLQNNQQVSEVYDNHNFYKNSRPVKMDLPEYA